MDTFFDSAVLSKVIPPCCFYISKDDDGFPHLQVIDDTVHENADFQHESGLNPKIVRMVVGKCCEWCNKIAGVYDYADIKQKKNHDVFKRHKHCNCKVEYVPGDGRRQNVHTKAWSGEVKRDIIQKTQYIGLSAEEDSIIKRIREEIIPKQKIDTIVERQSIHRKGSSLYEERKRQLKEKGQYGPSYITVSDDEIVSLIENYSGTGIIKYNNKGEWNNQETIVSNEKIIGVVVDNRNGNYAETSVFKIHYGKKGVHIVPDYPSKKR